MPKRYRGLLAAGVGGLGLLIAFYTIPKNRLPQPGGAPSDLAAAPTKPGPHPIAYTAAFDAELQKIGQITPQQFAERYPIPGYLAKLTWDPTAAKFFDKLNVDKLTKPGGERKLSNGRIVKFPPTDLPGYKLTDDELGKYKQYGFVATERLGSFSFGQLYYDVYNRDLPVFITSDSVLHAWHRSYDAMLEELELTYLLHSLEAIIAGMHEALPAANAQYGAGILKDSLRDADYYLTVARCLLRNVQFATKFGQDERLEKTLVAIKGEQIQRFELFGRMRDMDFSQFKPRGHYEAKPDLQRYFKAMMWCGRIDLRVAGGYDRTGPLSSPRELGAAMVLLDLLRKADKENAWRQFDHLIQTFVGRTDSATFDDLAKVAAAAKVNSPAALKTDADLNKLTDAIQNSTVGKQDIRGDVYISPGSPSLKVILPRSFTLLGQKFAVDSWVTAKTVFDDIMWNNDKVVRRVPSGLDVAFAALGNNHVVPDLVERIDHGSHRFRDRQPYQHNLAAARNVIDALEPNAWDETIYTSWLRTLRTLTAPSDAPLPEAMRTRAWAMKQTNTQLASWSQLRHDSILYVKQSYTSGAACYYPAGFVEPVVPFWTQMETMSKRSADLLEKTPFPVGVQATQTKQVQFLRNFATQMGRLKIVAEKQLNQKELNADESKILQDVMQIEHIPVGSGGDKLTKCTGWYPALFYRGPLDSLKWDALVADVHTDVPTPIHGDPGCVLHQGVGNVDLMIIAINNGKDRIVYAGPTLSHYEFEMPGVVRKTDKEWKADLLDGKYAPRPAWTSGYLVPRTDHKPIEARTKAELLREDR